MPVPGMELPRLAQKGNISGNIFKRKLTLHVPGLYLLMGTFLQAPLFSSEMLMVCESQHLLKFLK